MLSRARAVALAAAWLLAAGPVHVSAATLVVSVEHSETPARNVGRTVKLLGITADGETLTRESQTDASGRVRFGDLPAPAAYLVLAEYGSVSFHADSVRYTEEDDPDEVREVSVAIHEPSSDPSGIALSGIRLFLDHEAGAYRVDQVVELRNTSERVVTLSPDAPAPVRIALAPGHGELRTPTGLPPSGFELVDGVLEMRGPVHAGDRDLVFSYDLASEGSALSTDLRFPNEVPSLDLYVRDKRLAIEAPGLHPARTARDERGAPYLRFVGFDLPAGSMVPLRITPLPPVRQNSPYGVALAAALLGGLLFFYVARPVTRTSWAEPRAVEEAGEVEKQALYAALRDLEHDFETGKLSADDRDRLRAELRRDALAALARVRKLDAVHPEPELKPAEERSCESCGAPAGAEARFCSGCGAPL